MSLGRRADTPTIDKMLPSRLGYTIVEEVVSEELCSRVDLAARDFIVNEGIPVFQAMLEDANGDPLPDMDRSQRMMMTNRQISALLGDRHPSRARLIANRLHEVAVEAAASVSGAVPGFAQRFFMESFAFMANDGTNGGFEGVRGGKEEGGLEGANST